MLCINLNIHLIRWGHSGNEMLLIAPQWFSSMRPVVYSGAVCQLLKDNTGEKAALARLPYQQHRPPASTGPPALIRTGIFSSLGRNTAWILRQLTWLPNVVLWLDPLFLSHIHTHTETKNFLPVLTLSQKKNVRMFIIHIFKQHHN